MRRRVITRRKKVQRSAARVKLVLVVPFFPSNSPGRHCSRQKPFHQIPTSVSRSSLSTLNSISFAWNQLCYPSSHSITNEYSALNRSQCL
ncbi:hypothetical protein LY78DRAFT_368181 [Colletotrichum sublineola]|nr:hypothetical protein LY78DRAFT_368181 [Colletotrichum sublineola]